MKRENIFVHGARNFLYRSFVVLMDTHMTAQTLTGVATHEALSDAKDGT